MQLNNMFAAAQYRSWSMWAYVALVLALFQFPLESQAQTYTKKQLQDVKIVFLTGEGYRPELTSAGNVKFKHQGRTYIIYVDEKDATFYKMGLGFSAEDKSPAMRLRRLEAVNTVTFDTKVVKAYLDRDGDPNFDIEIYMANPADINKYFSRMLDAMDVAISTYYKKLGEN